MQMNVMITSAGRRTTLVRAFQEATQRRRGTLFAGDIDGLAPALYVADRPIGLRRVTDPEFIPHLLSVVERNGIRLVVPTIDSELMALAHSSAEFARVGCQALISDPELVHIASDKWETARVFGERGVRVPRSWLPDSLPARELPDKLFLKPRDGSASQHTFRTRKSELGEVLPRVPNPIIQEEIVAPEVTIDAFLDLRGRPIHYVPRLRIRAIGGESIQGVTLADDDLRDWTLRVLAIVPSLGGRGPVTLQAFLTPEGPVFSEINPRFGGGFPLTLQAGGHYPEWTMSMVEGHEVTPRIGDYQRDLFMTRSYTEFFTEEPLWKASVGSSST
jgi:carbamoyl-phosphate synthase large subunit